MKTTVPCSPNDVICAIRALTEERSPVLVALDGRCASGKTALANALAARYGWSVAHLDDFFLRPEQRTPERRATPGENVDHERFLTEVLLPLRDGRSASFHPFDCKAQRLSSELKTVCSAPVIIVEGAYACHGALWPHYDLRVFLTVERDEQLRRIERRNGPEGLAAFRETWIPLEELYFSAFSVEQRCDYRLALREPAAQLRLP